MGPLCFLRHNIGFGDIEDITDQGIPGSEALIAKAPLPLGTLIRVPLPCLQAAARAAEQPGMGQGDLGHRKWDMELRAGEKGF